MKRLLIISHTEHYRAGDQIVGHSATLREIDHLADLFPEVVHLACLHPGAPPASALPYASDNVRFVGVPPSGGASWRSKLNVLRLYPHYARVLWRELNRADAVHVRAPANISLLALGLLALRAHPRPRWFKYAGSWKAYDREARSYRLQRWWLNRGVTPGKVTVNGQWPDQPAHVHSFLNPCLTLAECEAGRAAAERKLQQGPLRLLFVGHLLEAKGVHEALAVLERLQRMEIPSHLTFVGDGPERAALEAQAQQAGLAEAVTFAGWVPRPQIAPYLNDAHFVILPSRSEGWPKVLSEGMAYGALPIAGAVGSIPGVLGRFEVGVVADPQDVRRLADGIAAYAEDPARWKAEVERAVAAAQHFSYETYKKAVSRLFGQQ